MLPFEWILPEAYYLRGLFARSKKQHTEVEHQFGQAFQLAPNDRRFLRAVLAYRLKRPFTGTKEEALTGLRKEFDKLEALASSSAEFFLAAHFFALNGETDRALRLGERGVSLSPVDPFVLSDYASVLESCGDLENAITVQCLALDLLYERQDLEKEFSERLSQLEMKSRTGGEHR